MHISITKQPRMAFRFQYLRKSEKSIARKHIRKHRKDKIQACSDWKMMVTARRQYLKMAHMLQSSIIHRQGGQQE